MVRTRSLSPSQLRLRLRYGQPSFIVPGAQKCGTTALAVFLQRHPRLQLSATKEPDFFLRDARYHRMGVASYRREFPRAGLRGRQVFFEASVGYLPDPRVPQRLAQFDPGLRFVVMVREPAARAHSAWNHYRRLCVVAGERARFAAWLEDHNPEDREAGLAMLAQDRFPSFAEAVEGELEAISRDGPAWTIPAIVATGLYASQLERFLALFPLDQFLVLEDRELERDPVHTLDRVLAFLGLEPNDWGDEFPRVFGGDYDRPPDEPTLARLRTFYAPHNEALFDLIGRRFDWGR